jgi:excisionase family DNA binding protein
VSRHEQTDATAADPEVDGVAVQVILDDKALKTIIEAVEERVLAHLADRNQGDGWPEWMSVETAARYLDCSEERVRKLVANNRLPSYSEGRGCRRFLNRSELDEAMKRLRT